MYPSKKPQWIYETFVDIAHPTIIIQIVKNECLAKPKEIWNLLVYKHYGQWKLKLRAGYNIRLDQPTQKLRSNTIMSTKRKQLVPPHFFSDEQEHMILFNSEQCVSRSSKELIYRNCCACYAIFYNRFYFSYNA